MNFLSNRKSLMRFGKWSLGILSLFLIVFFVFNFILPALAMSWITGTANVTTSVAPDKWTKNGSAEWYYFDLTFTLGANVTEINVTVPNVTTASNFSIANITNVPTINMTGWTVTYPENYTAARYDYARIIKFSVAATGNVSATADSYPSVRISVYATPLLTATGDTLQNDWGLSAAFANSTETTLNTTSVSSWVDSRTPVLNTTTPANNGYISGNSSQLFQAYVYDTNFDPATKNSSLYYRMQGAGAWQGSEGNMNCWIQTTPQYICNKTVNSLYDTYGNGAVIQFFFNATDNMTNVGNNGTTTTPLTVTIDRDAPTNSTTTVEKVASGTKYDTTGLVNYGFQMNWADASSGMSAVYFESNFTAGGATLANVTASNTSNGYYVNFTITNFNAAGTYAYKWYAKDSVSPAGDANWATTSTYYYTIAKADNPVSLYLNDTLNSNVNDLRYPGTTNASGAVTAGTVVLYRNVSGTLADVTGAENKQNITLDVGAHAYTVNTTGNANYSANNTGPSYYVLVGKGTVTLNLYLNTTELNYSINYPAAVNATGVKSSTTDSEYNMSLYRGGVIVSSTTSASSRSENIVLPNGTYNYSLVFNGSANYTDTSITADRFVLVSKGASTVDVKLNGSSANLTAASGAVVNITATLSHASEGNTTHNLTLYVNNVLYNSSTSLTQIENFTSYSGVPTYEFNVTGYYPETQNYSAGTKTWYVKIESTPPTYADNNTNVTATVWGKYQGVIGINAAWNDTFNLSRVWLLSNETGAWANTYGGFVGAKNSSNFTIDPSTVSIASGDAFVQAKIYANDTSNNTNNTNTWSWTIDGTTPVLSGTYPSNQSYIYRNNSYPFRVTVTDYTLNLTNGTVYWKRSIAGSYNSGSMTCTGTAPTFTCEKTDVNLDVYAEGNVIYYYFEVSDNSSLMGTVGSSTNPYVVTLDISAPTYSNNGTNVTVVGKYDGVKIYANWTDADNLDWAVLETNETGAAANKTTYDSPYNINNIDGQTWSNFSWSNSSLTPGTVVQWRIFANDSVGNQNVTPVVTFMIDNTIPSPITIYANTTNGTTTAKGTQIQLLANWTDNIGLITRGYWWVWINESNTTGANRSYTAFTSNNQTNSSYTIDTSSFTNGIAFTAKIYANDTSGNENMTDVWQWTIDGTAPKWYNNGTNVTSGETIPKGTPIFVYANWTDNLNVSQAWIQHNVSTLTNASVSITGTGNWTNYTIDTSTATAGAAVQARLFMNDTSGNENFTAPTWVWTIDGTAPTLGNITRNLADGNGSSEYAPGATYIFNTSSTDNLAGNVSKVLLNFSYSASNYSADSLGSNNYSVTITDLPVGNYSYKWYSNDTSNNWVETAVYFFNVTRNTTNPVNLYLNGTVDQNLTVIYPAQVNATAISIYPNSGAVNLYRNDSSVTTNNTNVRLGNATYVYVANTSGTVNYTSNSSTLYVFVAKGSVSINLTLNGTNDNVNYIYPQAVNATGWITAPNSESQYNLSLYRNDSIITSTTSETSLAQNILLGSADYNYTLVFNGSTNYTDTSIVSRMASVSKGVSNISLWINSTEANATTPQGTTLNVTATINTSYDVILKINTTITPGWVNQSTTGTRIENTTSTSTFTVANNYNVTASFDGDSNYTADSQTWWLNITQDVTPPTVKINDASLGYKFDNGTAKKISATFSLNISVSDNGIGLTSGEYCFAKIGTAVAQNFANYSGSSSTGWCNGTVTVPSLDDGAHLLNITVNDTNDNMGVNDTYYITVDNTAPIVTINVPTSNGTYRKSDSNGFVWINGTVSDNLQMGSGNVSINGTYFNKTPSSAAPFNFTGANGTAFAYNNTSAIADGYYYFAVNYTDNATNTGTGYVYFFVDNTAPSAVYGLTNSSSQNYAATTSQTIQARVDDALQTNGTVILNYYLNGTWFTAALTGTPGTTTAYTGIISTVHNSSLVANGVSYMPYYITGVDNATNSISNGGSPASPLGNLTFGTTGSIDGYVLRNGTSTVVSGATVSDGTRAAVSNSNGYYIISSVPAGTYTVTASATDYTSNSTSSVSVTAGATARANITMAYTATGTISGYIKVNGSSTVLAGATVSDGTRAAVTNNAGFYQITGVPAGTYTVTANLTNYVSNSTSATVTAGATTEANITMASNANGVIQGYVYLTNTSIVPNGTVQVSDGTRTANTNTAGFYQISSVPAGTYTLTVSGIGYRANSTSVTVTAGATTTQNMRATGAENFNITLPGTSGTSTTGFWDIGWRDFYFRTGIYSAGITNYTVEYLFLPMGISGNYNYSAVWRYNATSQGWSSFVPRESGNTLVNVSSSSDHYWIYVNGTDRVELEPRYV